jgi:hypothetical protein
LYVQSSPTAKKAATKLTVGGDPREYSQPCTSDFRGPGQYLSRLIIEKARVIANAGSTIELGRFLAIKASRETKKPTVEPNGEPKWSDSED